MDIDIKLDNFLMSEKKKKKKYSDTDIRNIVDEASAAFWATVSDMVPEADSGDLDPAVQRKLDALNAKAVISWIAFNTVQ